jgi:hypothetical protein
MEKCPRCKRIVIDEWRDDLCDECFLENIEENE